MRRPLDNDGSSAFRFLATPIRIVCANTQSAAIGSAKASFAIRHTGGARASIQEARNALTLSWRYVQAFEAEAAKLYAQPMDTEQVRRFADTLLEVDAAGSEATARHRRERASGIVKLWTSSPFPTACAGITLWPALMRRLRVRDVGMALRTRCCHGSRSGCRFG